MSVPLRPHLTRLYLNGIVTIPQAMIYNHFNKTKGLSIPMTTRQASRPRTDRASRLRTDRESGQPIIVTMKFRYVGTVLANVTHRLKFLSLNVCGLRWKLIDPHFINFIDNDDIIGL